MDDELRQAFATFSGQMSDFAGEQRNLSSAVRDMSRNFQRLDSTVADLGDRMTRAEKSIYGSNPPPALPAPSFNRRMSSAEGDVAELTGRVMGLESKLDANTKETIATKHLLERNTAATEKIERAFTGIVSSPTVQKVTRLLTLALLGWLAAKGYLHP
jgi:outer membrane murein-binding lipoprotein Lpp